MPGLDWLNASALSIWGAPVSMAELLGFVLTLAMVACNMRVHPAAWPLAITGSLLYVLVFVSTRLYGQAMLQFVFIGLAFWGWAQWLRGIAHSALLVRHATPDTRWRCLAFTLGAWCVLGLGLGTASDSPLPWLDALPTAASLTAQWMLARKYIENWPLWVAVNALSVWLFALSGLWLTAVLYAVLALLALAGWWQWHKLQGRAHA
jgi:nicotinamide mononucleotide transporter